MWLYYSTCQWIIGNAKAVKKETKKINKNIKILGVAVLTSFNNKSLKQIGHTKKIKQLVLKQAELINKSSCDGMFTLQRH